MGIFGGCLVMHLVVAATNQSYVVNGVVVLVEAPVFAAVCVIVCLLCKRAEMMKRAKVHDMLTYIYMYVVID